MKIKFSQYDWFDPGNESVFLLASPPESIPLTYRALCSLARAGRTGRSGRRVRLRVCRLPQGIGTTVEEYRRLISALNEE